MRARTTTAGSALALLAACATAHPAPAQRGEPAVSVASAPNANAPESVPASFAPVSDRAPEPAARSPWPLFEGAGSACSACLPNATSGCEKARSSCSDPECAAYLDCVRSCPPPEARDADGGYPQADCVIACHERHPKGAELGDAYLWCVCCDSPCRRDCSDECGKYKSGIAGPIGAGCD